MNALFTKLQWQLQEVCQTLLDLEKEMSVLDKEITDNQQKIFNSCIIPAFILPEQEIARVHFMTLQNKNQEQLHTRKTMLLAEQTTLQREQIRLNTELKMLEKHQNGKLKIQQQQALQTQQNNSDEWILQRLGSL